MAVKKKRKAIGDVAGLRRRHTIVHGVPVTRDALAVYIGEILETRQESGFRVRVKPEDPTALDRLDAKGGGFQNFWASSDPDGNFIRAGMLRFQVHGDNWSDFLFTSSGPAWVAGDHLWAERV